MHKTEPEKKHRLGMRIKMGIGCGAVCAFLASNCFAAENESTEIVVDGQVTVQEEMPDTDDALEKLLTEVEAALPADNGEWSVYICDLEGGFEGSVNEQSMQAASLIKLYIMGAVYESYEELTAAYGKEMIDANLYAMITVSDNEAANVLTNYLGGDDFEKGMREVSEYCLEKGFTCSSMGRLLLQSNEFGDNYTSVCDCGRFLKAVYENDEETFRYTEEMFRLLSEQTRRNKIPAGLPEGVAVANKTGELADVENDAGIIYDTEHDLILVFMSQNLRDAGAAQQTIAAISRQVYEYYNDGNNKSAE